MFDFGWVHLATSLAVAVLLIMSNKPTYKAWLAKQRRGIQNIQNIQFIQIFLSGKETF
jgi:hypothetical protein